jgi:predicted nuclease with RNAse H fold
VELVVAGIDVGGKTTGRTSVAIAEGAPGGIPTVRILRHDADSEPLARRAGVRTLARTIGAAGARTVAVDAPLSLPHPLTCTDPACRRCWPADGTDADYSSRPADRAALWTGAGHAVSPMPTAMLGAITFRGVYLRRALERAGLAVVETWPRGVLASLEPDAAALPSSSADEGAYLTAATERLGAHLDLGDDLVTAHDIDAAACALAGWHHVQAAEPVHVGDEEASICLCHLREWA